MKRIQDMVLKFYSKNLLKTTIVFYLIFKTMNKVVWFLFDLFLMIVLLPILLIILISKNILNKS